MGTFDPKRVPITDWLVMGAGVLIFILSFLPWYSASLELDGQDAFDVPGAPDPTRAAWYSGFGAWFPVLLLLAAAVLVAVAVFAAFELPKVPGGIRTVAGVLAGVGAIIIVLRWLTYGDLEDYYQVPGGVVPEGADASSGAGWALYLGLLVAIAAAVAAFMGSRSAPQSAVIQQEAPPTAEPPQDQGPGQPPAGQ